MFLIHKSNLLKRIKSYYIIIVIIINIFEKWLLAVFMKTFLTKMSIRNLFQALILRNIFVHILRAAGSSFLDTP